MFWLFKRSVPKASKTTRICFICTGIRTSQGWQKPAGPSRGGGRRARFSPLAPHQQHMRSVSKTEPTIPVSTRARPRNTEKSAASAKAHGAASTPSLIRRSDHAAWRPSLTPMASRSSRANSGPRSESFSAIFVDVNSAASEGSSRLQECKNPRASHQAFCWSSAS